MEGSSQSKWVRPLISGNSGMVDSQKSKVWPWALILSSFFSWVIVTIGTGAIVAVTLLLIGYSETTSINLAILVSYLAIIPLTGLLIYADGSVDDTMDSMRLESVRKSLKLVIVIPIIVTLIDFVLVVLYGISYDAILGEPSPNTDIGVTWDSGLAAIGVTFFSIAILAPIAEELMFRGYLLESIKRLHGDVVAVIASSILFGLAHFPDPYTMGMATIGGMLYGYVKIRTGSLWPSIISHLIWNMIALAVTYL